MTEACLGAADGSRKPQLGKVMRLKASCGNLPKSVGLNEQVYSLTIIANCAESPDDLLKQRRLLAEFYKEARDGNLWYWCEKMRKARLKDNRKKTKTIADL